MCIRDRTTTINTTNLVVEDNKIVVNSSQSGTPASSVTAGIEVERGSSSNKSFVYAESNVGESGNLSSGWTFGSERVQAGTFFGTFIGDITGSPSSLAGLTTDNLSEGVSNLYFTNARARGALSAGNGITYNSSTGGISANAGSGISVTGSGINVSGVTFAMLAGSAVQTSSESFSDSNSLLMTAAAIQDKIQSFGFTTNVGDITGVNATAGSGLTGTSTTTSGTAQFTFNVGAGSGISVAADSVAVDTTVMRNNSDQTLVGQLIVSDNSGVTGSSAPTYTQANIELYTSSNHVPALSFHRSGYSATTLYEYDGQLYANAWTTRAQTGLLLSTGNIGSYALTSSSTIDADTLDSLDSASFMRTDAGSNVTNYTHRHAYYSNTNIATTASYQASLECFSSGSGGDAFMTFHVGGDYAAYFGLDGGINDLAYGGWSAGANSYRIFHAGNSAQFTSTLLTKLNGIATGATNTAAPNNPTITITQTGISNQTFTLNQSGNTTIALADTNTDTNTTYSAGSGLSLNGTTFSIAGTGSLITNLLNVNTIVANNIDANAITAEKISSGSITAEELAISNNASGSAGIYFSTTAIEIRDASRVRVKIGAL